MLPNDPYLLLSVINMKLRDFDGDFATLCDHEDVDGQALLDKLATIGYVYVKEQNQFRPAE